MGNKFRQQHKEWCVTRHLKNNTGGHIIIIFFKVIQISSELQHNLATYFLSLTNPLCKIQIIY